MEYEPPAPWFRNTLLSGLQTLYVLRLSGSPSADTLPALADVWIGALWLTRAWTAQRDEPRIQRAFMALAASCKTWPSPADLIAALPRPPEQRRLPGPPNSRDRSQEISAMLAHLRGHTRMSEDRPADIESARATAREAIARLGRKRHE